MDQNPLDQDSHKHRSPHSIRTPTSSKSNGPKSHHTSRDVRFLDDGYAAHGTIILKDSNMSAMNGSSSSNGTDDSAIFGLLVTHKLRSLSLRNAIMAQADIMTILQKYVLAELESG